MRLLGKQFSSGVTLSPFWAGLPARKTDYRAACTGIALFWVSLFNWKGAKYRLREALLKGVDNPIETIDTLSCTKVRFQMEHLVQRAEILVPESRITDYLLSLQRIDIESLKNDQLRKITSEVERADLALAVLQELHARLEQSKVEEDTELGMRSVEDVKTSKFIEDMRHHLVWDHHGKRR